MPSSASTFANSLSRITTTRDAERKEAAMLTALLEAAKAMEGYERRLAALEAAERSRANQRPDHGPGSLGKSGV